MFSLKITFTTALLAITIAACTPVTPIRQPEPARVGEIEQQRNIAPARLICKTLGQVRSAASSLTRQQLQSIIRVRQNDLPRGCAAARPPTGTESTRIGRVSTRDNEWRVMALELQYPEPEGSLFERAVWYSVDANNARLPRRRF